MQVKQLINNKYSSNTYLITNHSSSFVWLIDISEGDELLRFISDDLTIKGVFITHSHFDHIYGLNQLLQAYPGCVLYISSKAVEGLYSDKINLSFYHEDPVIYTGSNINVIGEGSIIEVFKGCRIEVIETPGHNPGCLTYKLKNYLFTGDSFIPNVEVVTKLKGGDKKANRESLKKIMGIINKDTVICPGHGPMVNGSNLLITDH